MTAMVKALLLCGHSHKKKKKKKSFSVWTVIEIVIATRYFKPSIIKYAEILEILVEEIPEDWTQSLEFWH